MLAMSVLDQWYKIAGIVIAVPVAWIIARNISGAFSYIRIVHEAIAGRPKTPLDEGRPSMIERFEKVDLTLADQNIEIGKIKKELSFNGGGTVKDQVTKLVVATAGLKTGQETAATTAATVKRDLDAS